MQIKRIKPSGGALLSGLGWGLTIIGIPLLLFWGFTGTDLYYCHKIQTNGIESIATVVERNFYMRRTTGIDKKTLQVTIHSAAVQ